MPKESVYYKVDSVNDKHGIKHIKRELNTLAGVSSVSISNTGDMVAVDFDNTGTSQKQIESKLTKLGYEISLDYGEKHLM